MMYCTKCGKENAEGMAFCGGCGSPLSSASLQKNQTAKADSRQQASYIPAPPKSKKGLLIALIAGNVLLMAAAAVLIVLLTAAAPILGIWYNELEGDVLVFDNDGSLTVYALDSKLDGTYDYNKQSGKGTFKVLTTQFTFEIEDDVMNINDLYDYNRALDEDFDIASFVNKYAVASADNMDVPESIPEPPVQTQAPVSTPEPVQTQAPATPNPTPEPVPVQNDDAALAEQLVLNTWFTVFKQENDGTQMYIYAEDADEYTFFEDGTHICQYAYSDGLLNGRWEVSNGQLTVTYETSEIGTATWDMEIEYGDENVFLTLSSIKPGEENVYWIYADDFLE